MNRLIRGLDYSFGRPDLNAVKAQGYRFVLRYLTGVGKALTAAERKSIESHGLAFGVVFESTAARAGQGRGAGVVDAATANRALGLLGLGGMPVYFAVDFDASPGQVMPYFQGVRSVFPHSRIGVYGGYRVVSALADAGVVKWVWQTVAWSGGRVYPGSHIFQHAPSVRVGGADVDVNDAAPEAFGSFRGAQVSKPRRYASRMLRQGDKGEDVRELQRILSGISAPHIVQDGDYGPATEKAKHDAMWKLGWPDSTIKARDKSRSIGVAGQKALRDPQTRPQSYKAREKQRAKK